MVVKVREVEVFFTLDPDNSWPVGVLAAQGQRLFFEYSPDWLKRNLELSPFILPLKSGLFEHQQREFGPLFGLFDDSLPDGWGLLLMDRYFRQSGLNPASLSPLDRLLYLGRRTMGALTYHPATWLNQSDAGQFNLHELASHSRQILAGAEGEVLPLLLRAGGSPGGARPKVLVGYNPHDQTLVAGDDDLSPGFAAWIVKFSAREEARDAGSVEYAYALMAAAAGLEMPNSRLFRTRQGDAFFGVKRFDRGPGNRRYHIHTFGNLIQSDFRVPACDYSDLLKVTLLLTRNHTELLRAYRLMLFNVLSCNRDDHVKNFSFILDDVTGQWRLSPAYDLTFSSGPGGEHSTTVAGEGRAPAYEHFVKLSEQFGISTKEMKKMICEVAGAVERWPEFAEKAGVSAAKIRYIAGFLAASI
ncbi:MAG: type II toxin-antitoxin system HipA family toxin [Deltaproteobacteria bacterium]|nr:type II toxin-antitoxin system HipA family toxin [Candidatus Tharpella aukensis]